MTGPLRAPALLAARCAALLASALAAGCAIILASGCAGGAGTRHLVVLQSTDVHGFYSGTTDRAGEPVGGLRRLAALVDAEEARGHAVLLVDSGDMWSGTLLSDGNEGALGVAAYNALHYAAAALGNHELDYGPVGPRRDGGAEPFGALLARLEEARFPVLAANLVDRATGLLPAWPNLRASVLVERAGFRIGLVGAITTETPQITWPHVGAALAFTDPAEAIAREAAELRARGAEVVLALVHEGGACGRFDDPADTSSCEDASPLFRIVRALPPGAVDAVLGGHTHAQIAHLVAGVPVVQAGSYGRAVGRLELRAGPGEPVRVALSPPLPLTGEARGPTVALVDALLVPYEQEVAQLRREPLGARLVRPLTRDRERSSSLGSFVCDVLLDRFPDREVCLVNSGGLREDLPAGELTYGALYDALPFGNEVAHLEVSGEALRELLRLGTSGAHGVSQVAGVAVTYDLGRDPCPTADRNGDGVLGPADRDRLVKVTLADGSPLEDARVYRLVTNSFLARGGDAWASVVSRLHPDRVHVLAEAPPVRDVLAAWLRERRPVLNSPDRPVMPEARVQALGQAPDLVCPAP